MDADHDDEIKHDESIPDSDTNTDESITPYQNLQYGRLGGPYTKGERRRRRAEVWRLHLEEELPATKISDLMKINRNTINGDVDYCYTTVAKQMKGKITGMIFRQILRMENQRSRLLGYLKNAADEEKIDIEKLISDLDEKITNILLKIDGKNDHIKTKALELVNTWAEKYNWDVRALDPAELLVLPAAKLKKIKEVLHEN